MNIESEGGNGQAPHCHGAICSNPEHRFSTPKRGTESDHPDFTTSGVGRTEGSKIFRTAPQGEKMGSNPPKTPTGPE